MKRLGAAVFAFVVASAWAQTATPASPSAPVVIPDCAGPGITMPVMQTRISLAENYPPLSTVLGEEGATDLLFVIKSNGTVSDAKVWHSSGSLRLDDAAVSLARQIIYSQPKMGATAIDCRHSLRISWRLSDNAQAGMNAAGSAVFSPPQSLYPAAALAQHREGATFIVVIIDPNGAIMKETIARSTGSDDLDAASLAYVKSRSFKPMQIDGKPAMSVTFVAVAWTLYPAKAPPAANH